MLLEYIRWSIRYAKKRLFLSAINIVGLAFGIACTLAIFLYVYGEWSYDRHFKNAKNIYRIGIGFFNMGPYANGPEVLNEILSSEFGGIKAFTSFQKNDREILKVNEEIFKQEVYYVDSSFFRVFSYQFLKGDPSKAITNTSSIVITESISKKFFGDQEPIGKLIAIGKSKTPFQVSGVVADDLNKSHLKASIWVSRPYSIQQNSNWTSASFYNYVMLKDNVERNDLENALGKIIEKYIYPVLGSRKTSVTEYNKDDNALKFVVQPITDIYLKSKLVLELSPGGNATNLYILTLIDLFIITLAIVNFINLSTSQSVQRAKEIGIRKALGSSRAQLMAQFTIESVLASFLALALAIFLLKLVVGTNLGVTESQIPTRILVNPIGIIGLLLFAGSLGVVAGVYPAIYLSSFSAARALKGSLEQVRTKMKLFLVGFQFSVSISLIICTLVINGQLRYMSAKNLGFDQGNVLVIDNLYYLDSNSASIFRDRISENKDIRIASLHLGEPGGKYSYLFTTLKTSEMKDPLTIATYFADDHFIKLMGFNLISGRDFIKGASSDSSGVILNEAAVKALSIQGDPIDKELSDGLRVIGVLANFHTESLRSEIAPLVIMLPNPKLSKTLYGELSLKMRRGARIQSAIKGIEHEWKQITEEEFEYHQLSNNFKTMLENENSLAQVISFFAGLAIFISCLGLFGLSTLLISLKTKEIGIRKVMGATMLNILFLVNKEFLKPVIFAIAIGAAVAYYSMEKWLGNFAYHGELQLKYFIFAGVIGLAVSAITISYHSIKASIVNPVKALKEE